LSRCREVAGVLFKHPCRAEAVTACAACRKPVCGLHSRQVGQQTYCVTCLRNQLRDPRTRGSYAYLRDDPFFYWYYNDDTWFDDPYGADDYALFDGGPDTFQGGGGDFGGGGASDDWGGS
jgi:uncharacterized membrane protein YgcG